MWCGVEEDVVIKAESRRGIEVKIELRRGRKANNLQHQLGCQSPPQLCRPPLTLVAWERRA